MSFFRSLFQDLVDKRLWPVAVVLVVAAVAVPVVLSKSAPQADTVSTHKAMYGIVIFTLWIVLLTAVAWAARGALAALIVFVALPIIGLAVLTVGERWRDAWGEAQRFVLRVRRGDLIEAMKLRQKELAGRLEAVRSESA